jgi:hypothetical protein
MDVAFLERKLYLYVLSKFLSWDGSLKLDSYGQFNKRELLTKVCGSLGEIKEFEDPWAQHKWVVI